MQRAMQVENTRCTHSKLHCTLQPHSTLWSRSWHACIEVLILLSKHKGVNRKETHAEHRLPSCVRRAPLGGTKACQLVKAAEHGHAHLYNYAICG